MIATVVNWDKNYIECDGTKRVSFGERRIRHEKRFIANFYEKNK